MAKLVMGQLTISERQQPGRIVCKCVKLIITSRYYYDYSIQSNMGDPILIYCSVGAFPRIISRRKDKENIYF